MKYCEEYAALLDLFVDGELPSGEMERVQAHLDVCPGCRAYVDDALAIRAGFPDVEDTAVPEGFAESVMKRVREEAGRGAKIVELKRRSVRRWVGSLAALAACCGLAILLKTGYGGGNSTATSAGGADVSAAYDIAGDEGDGPAPRTAEELNAAPQTGPSEDEEGTESESRMAETMEPDAVPPEGGQKQTAGQAETQMTAKSGDTMDGGTAVNRAQPSAPGEPTPYVSAAASAPEAMADAAEPVPALRLTTGEAGVLLDRYDPIWEDAGERRYELNAEEYRALLEALGRSDETEGAVFIVAVIKPAGEQPVQRNK